MNKKLEAYETPEMEVIQFATEDVITNSGDTFDPGTGETPIDPSSLDPHGNPMDAYHLG